MRNDVPVYLPNAFSPNQLGENEIFFVQANPEVVVEVKTFQVYDRWGESHFIRNNFRPNDPGHGWDGTMGGQELNPGVYVWFVEVELVDGTTRIITGDVALLK